MFSIKFKTVFVLLAFLSSFIALGCGLGDDDFTDTPYAQIEKIIVEDTAGLFEPGLNDDGDSLFTADLSKALAQNGASDFWKTAAYNINFGRLVQPLVIDPKRDITIDVQDTIGYATVNYILRGSFIIDSSGTRFTKLLRHRLSRFITFVKNPATDEEWQPLTISAAYGSSLDPATLAENTRLAIDSIWIAVPQGNIIVDDPAEIVNYYKNPITLHNNDSIVVFVKVRNRIDGFDKPIGFVTNGKNKENQFRRRLAMTRIPFTDYFRKTVYVEASQKRGFNQLVIDFLTQGSINRRSRPYDSYMIAIPYKVE